MKKNVIIIGCDISSLYAGFKFLKNGYNVTIIDRNNGIKTMCNNDNYNNCFIYDESNRTYIKLLQQFGFNGKTVKKKRYNNVLIPILIKIKSNLKKVPICYYDRISAFNVIHKYLSHNEMMYLEQLNLNPLLSVINIYDFIDLFLKYFHNTDIFYSLNNNSFNLLIKRMYDMFIKKGGEIIFNVNIDKITYNNDRFYLNNIYICDFVFTTISQHNLIKFNIWSDYHKMLMKSVCQFDSHYINDIIQSNIDFQFEKNKSDVSKLILHDLHIAYPSEKNQTKPFYFWKYNTNKILTREEIKGMYNDRFIICSKSFSKNNLFINSNLEYIDSVLSR